MRISISSASVVAGFFLCTLALGDIGRGGTLRCTGLAQGVTATATLTWTQNGVDIPGSADSWSCSNTNPSPPAPPAVDSHDTVQPEYANDWHLTISFADANGPMGSCQEAEPLFFAGHPQVFTVNCPAGGRVLAGGTSEAEFTLQGTPGEASSLRAAHNDGTGLIDVSFAPACYASDHTIYFGDLASVSTYAYAGAICGVGPAGIASFGCPLVNCFFLVVGEDGVVEGSYGRSSSGERPEDVGTAGCDLPQVVSAVPCE